MERRAEMSCLSDIGGVERGLDLGLLNTRSIAWRLASRHQWFFEFGLFHNDMIFQFVWSIIMDHRDPYQGLTGPVYQHHHRERWGW